MFIFRTVGNNKQQLHKTCIQKLEQSVVSIQKVIAEAREATANETKSSMGDKYETTREMLQQEINMNMERLKKAQNDLSVLTGINSDNSSEKVAIGSLVETNNGIFYISISVGKTVCNDQVFYVISPSSPIGKMLLGKAENEEISFNNKKYIISRII